MVWKSLLSLSCTLLRFFSSGKNLWRSKIYSGEGDNTDEICWIVPFCGSLMDGVASSTTASSVDRLHHSLLSDGSRIGIDSRC